MTQFLKTFKSSQSLARKQISSEGITRVIREVLAIEKSNKTYGEISRTQKVIQEIF